MTFDDPFMFMEDADRKRLKRTRSPLTIWLHRDRAFYMRQMRASIDAARVPWPEKLKSAQRVRGEIDALGQRNRFVQMQHLLSLLLLPSTDAFFEAAARLAGSRYATRAAVAVQRYRQSHGEWPTELGQLVPKYLPTVPIDPYNGRPLQYRIDGDRCLIYSVGKDLVDSGGSGDLLRGQPDRVFAIPIVSRERVE